jgi:acyl-CoA thioester hydrolase
MGVVYHAEYLVWCEIGRTEYIRALGLPYAEMEQRGTFLAVADASLRYHAPARYDDRIRVETTLQSAGSRAITFEYAIFNADTGVKLVSARTMLVALDPSGRATTIPNDIRERMQAELPGAR